MGTKKYYWLKLKDDFFRQKEIKKLRKVAGGDTYTIIYLKMLLLAIKNDNKLFFDGVEDDFSDELALELDEDEENVKMTLAFLFKQKLVEMISEDEFLLTKCETMTGVESSSAERVRKHRLKQKEEQKALQCNTNVTSSNKNVTTEQEKEIEQEQEQELEQEKELEIEKEKQQHIEKKDVVDKVSMYFPYLNEKDMNSIINEFLKANKDLYYLTEKLMLVKENEKIENKVGYLIKAIKDNYTYNLVSSVENLLYVWEQEHIENPNNLLVKDKLEFFRNLKEKN